jgi:hypothetical protein
VRLLDMILRGQTGLQAMRRTTQPAGRLAGAPRDAVADARVPAIIRPPGVGSSVFEYDDCQEMIRAFYAERPPIVVSPVLIDRYKMDWARKQAFSNQTVWFVYCNHGGVVECVWWISGNNVHASIHGMKYYDMRGTGADAPAATAADATSADTQNG